MNHPSYIKLVFTVASEKELPKPWINALGYPVVKSKALLSGGLSRLSSQHSGPGLVFLVTGVGPENAKRAADAIVSHMNPLAIVNIGTCGLNQKDYSFCRPGAIILPAHTMSPSGQCLRCIRPPFPLTKSLNIKRTQKLQSLTKPLLGHDPTKAPYVDMEAWFQHDLFALHEIPFCSIKVVTDLCSPSTPGTYNKHLSKAVQRIQECLSFLDHPIKPTDISVVIPAYNRAWSIKRAIQSVLSQSKAPKEVIVVDDGSTDATKEIAKTKNGHIRLITVGKNQGVSNARNIGIAASRGSWIALLDSDDEWERDKLLHHIEYLHKYPFFQILQCDEIWIRRGKRVNKRKYHEKKEGWIWHQGLERCMISPSCTVVRKKLIEEFGLFDRNMAACEDYDLWLRISRHHMVGFDKRKDVIRYGGHKDQLSMRYAAMDRFRVYALIKALEEEKEAFFMERIRQEIKKRLSILTQGAIKRGKFSDATMYQRITEALFSGQLKASDHLFLLEKRC